MSRDAFEQLVSAWLDEPKRDDLRRRIDAALDADPRLRPVFDEWRRFDAWLQTHAPSPAGVDWQAQRKQIAAVVGQGGGDDAALDQLLAGLPGIEHRVDWDRLRGRITGAALPARAGGRRRMRRVIGLLAASAAAAAAIVWAIRPAVPPPVGPVGDEDAVQVVVHMPTAEDAPAEPAGTVIVRIAGTDVRETTPERFFILDPIVSAAPAADFPDVY